MIRARTAIAGMCAVLLVSLLAACGGSSTGSGSGQKTLHWDYLIWSPVSQPWNGFFNSYAQEIKTKTHGQLVIRILNASQNTPLASTDALTAVRAGQVQMSDAYGGFVAGSSGLAAVPTYPFLIPSIAELGKVFPAYQPFLTKELQKFNAQLLLWYPVPMQNLFGSGTPVTSLQGLAHKKIRSTSPQQNSFLDKLGADPVDLGSTELAPALTTGVVSGFTASALFASNAGLGSTLKWGFTPGVNAAPSYVVVNQKDFDSAPKDIQSVVESVSKEYQGKLFAAAQTIDDQAIAKLRQQGVVITTGTDQDRTEGAAIAKPLWAGFASKAGGDAPAALKAIEAAVGG